MTTDLSTDTAETFLHRLFGSDSKSEDFYQRNPLYRGDALIGAKPWWPPLSQVWAERGDEHPFDPAWADALERLESLHEQYVQTRPRKKVRK